MSPAQPSRRRPALVEASAVALASLTALASVATAAGDAKVRVGTLLPFAAAALERVPEHAVVVATVRRSAGEAPPAAHVDLGSPHAPSFERLAESGAQLVVADRDMHAVLVEKLARGGAEVLLIDTSSVASTLDGLRELGRRVGAGDEMERAVREAEAGIAGSALAAPVPTLPFFGAPGSFLVITERTWLGDLLGKLNFQNLAAESSGKESFPGYVQVSDEVLASMQPALVLLVAHGDPEAIRSAFLRRADPQGPWKSFHAARHGVHVLDARTFGANPGLALPEAARQLRGLVEPETAASRPAQ
jgi:iron complex transport system substrate-binding protein